MANPSIGSFSFISATVSGNLALSNASQKKIQRPGVDGAIFLISAEQPVEFTVDTLCDHSTAAAAGTALGTYIAYINSSRTFTDGNGLGVTNLVVLGVERVGMLQRGATPVGGVNGGAYLQRCKWRLHATSSTTMTG